MSDIFNEIDEDLRRDQFRKLWDRFGIYVLIVAGLIVVGVAGWRGYEYWMTRQAEAAGDHYYAAVKLAETGDAPGAVEALARLAKDGPSGYRLIATLRAAALAAQGDRAEGIKAFEAAAKMRGMPRVMADLAEVQAAWLAVDSEDLGAIRARLRPFLTASHPFRHSARETLTLSAMKAGDWTLASETLAALQTDADLPQSLERRVELLAAVVKSSAPVTSAKPKAP